MIGITGFDRGVSEHVVAVAKRTALMEIFKLAILEISEKSLLPEFGKIHIFFGKRIVFQKVINFFAFFHCFDDFHTFSGGEKRGYFTHNVLSGFQGPDGMIGVGSEICGNQNGIDIFSGEKFVFVIGYESCRAIFLNLSVSLTKSNHSSFRVFFMSWASFSDLFVLKITDGFPRTAIEVCSYSIVSAEKIFINSAT